MTRRKVAVLISGRGSNMQALIDACADETFPAEIVLVLSNVPKAFGLKRAKQAGIKTAIVNHKDFEGREAFDQAMDERIRKSGAELICLAGFMRLLTEGFVSAWNGKLLNIHPSLLPAFKGLHTHERALETGVRFTGCTVHFVSPAMDDGPIICQAAVPIGQKDTADTLGAKVLEAEHRIYPLALKLVAEGRTKIHGEGVDLDGVEEAEGTVLNPKG